MAPASSGTSVALARRSARTPKFPRGSHAWTRTPAAPAKSAAAMAGRCVPYKACCPDDPRPAVGAARCSASTASMSARRSAAGTKSSAPAERAWARAPAARARNVTTMAVASEPSRAARTSSNVMTACACLLTSVARVGSAAPMVTAAVFPRKTAGPARSPVKTARVSPRTRAVPMTRLRSAIRVKRWCASTGKGLPIHRSLRPSVRRRLLPAGHVLPSHRHLLPGPAARRRTGLRLPMRQWLHGGLQRAMLQNGVLRRGMLLGPAHELIPALPMGHTAVGSCAVCMMEHHFCPSPYPDQTSEWCCRDGA